MGPNELTHRWFVTTACLCNQLAELEAILDSTYRNLYKTRLLLVVHGKVNPKDSSGNPRW